MFFGFWVREVEWLRNMSVIGFFLLFYMFCYFRGMGVWGGRMEKVGILVRKRCLERILDEFISFFFYFYLKCFVNLNVSLFVINV